MSGILKNFTWGANTIARESLRYINEFMSLKCAPDLLLSKVFPNAKEITESMGAYRAVCKFYRRELGEKDIEVVVVGDGCTPRTAALFAYRSAWECHSIDPRMRTNKKYKIDRLWLYPDKVEVVLEKYQVVTNPNNRIILVAVHSHAPLEAAVNEFSGDLNLAMVVAIPCCVPQTIGDLKPDVQYDDWGITSPCRTVKIWRFWDYYKGAQA